MDEATVENISKNIIIFRLKLIWKH